MNGDAFHHIMGVALSLMSSESELVRRGKSR